MQANASSLAGRITYLRSAASPSSFRDRSTNVTFSAPTNQHDLLDCCTERYAPGPFVTRPVAS
jgi:hypothetical protein